MDINGQPIYDDTQDCPNCGLRMGPRNRGEDGICGVCTWGQVERRPDIRQQIRTLEMAARANRSLMNNWRHDGQHRYAKWAEEALEKNLAAIEALEAQLNKDGPDAA